MSTGTLLPTINDPLTSEQPDSNESLPPIYGGANPLVGPMSPKIPIVDCMPSNEGVPSGIDVRNIIGQTIHVAGDPDLAGIKGESFTFTISGDPEVEQIVEAKMAKRVATPNLSLEQRIILTQDFYREMAKAERYVAEKRRINKLSAASSPSPLPVPSPVTDTEPPMPELPDWAKESSVPSPPSKPPVPVLPPVARERKTTPQERIMSDSPGMTVEFAMADGGCMVVNYDHVVIQGDTLVLVTDAQRAGGFYRPPRTTETQQRPIRFTVRGMEGPPMIAYLLLEPYLIGGYWHTPLLLDNNG